MNGSARCIRLIWENGVTRPTSDHIADVQQELSRMGFEQLPSISEMLISYIQPGESPQFAVWIKLATIEYMLILPNQHAYVGWMKTYLHQASILDRIFGRL